ncbi:MAG: hypothetical protein AB7P76_13020 [Candidatus Melainabacteria bacterium]
MGVLSSSQKSERRAAKAALAESVTALETADAFETEVDHLEDEDAVAIALPVTTPMTPPPAWTPTHLDQSISDNEEVSSSITQTWTDQAIKCYVTQADCANCVIPKGNYSFKCQMYKVVPKLLETLNAPDPRRVRKMMPYLHQ